MVKKMIPATPLVEDHKLELAIYRAMKVAGLLFADMEDDVASEEARQLADAQTSQPEALSSRSVVHDQLGLGVGETVLSRISLQIHR